MSTIPSSNKTAPASERTPSWRELLQLFLYLGLCNFGGPVTQINRMYKQIVERGQWLSKEHFERVMACCHALPGPEALHLAIYTGYLKKRFPGGLLSGLMFILPGAALILLLSQLYLTYTQWPRVALALVVLKPAVLGIITAGAIKLGAATIRNFFLAAISLGAFVALNFTEVSLLLVLLAAGSLNLLASGGLPRLRTRLNPRLSVVVSSVMLLLFYIHPHWLRLVWLFLKTGMFSFGGAYASLAFLQQGAVEDYRWLSPGQLLDGVALGVATPGPFMLFSTYVGYLSGGIHGAILATFFVFLPSFVFVLAGAPYVEKIAGTELIRSFLDGVSAAIVGVIIVMTIELAPEVLLQSPSVVIAIAAMLAIVLLKVDVAIVAGAAIIGGILFTFLA